MQTFIVDHNMAQSAQALDNKRLGKQRVETVQILNTLLGLSKGWQNHPAVKMWHNYEGFLLYEYLIPVNDEWKSRGFKSEATDRNIIKLRERFWGTKLELVSFARPPWITNDFIEAHRSNLIRKDPLFYGPKWPQTKENLPYIWPVGSGQSPRN